MPLGGTHYPRRYHFGRWLRKLAWRWRVRREPRFYLALIDGELPVIYPAQDMTVEQADWLDGWLRKARERGVI